MHIYVHISVCLHANVHVYVRIDVLIHMCVYVRVRAHVLAVYFSGRGGGEGRLFLAEAPLGRPLLHAVLRGRDSVPRDSSH